MRLGLFDVSRRWPRQRTRDNDRTSFREQRNFFTLFRSISRPYITFKLPRGDMDTAPRPRNFFRYLAIGMCHFRRLWNGMCDHHRAEITVMLFTCHSLPVHQFGAVLWDFNPVRYCQPSSPTPMEYALPPSLEWHVWRGRRSIYNKRTNTTL